MKPNGFLCRFLCIHAYVNQICAKTADCDRRKFVTCDDYEVQEVVKVEKDSKYQESHLHPHPTVEHRKNFKTIIRFTYDDNDEMGPKNWGTVPSAHFATNDCGNNKHTPINIVTSRAQLAEADTRTINRLTEDATLTFISSEETAEAGWLFGFPKDIFNGSKVMPFSNFRVMSLSTMSIVAIMPRRYGTFLLSDEFDSHIKDDGAMSRLYDFTLALVTFCDFDVVSQNRSSHRIDGERFPVEFHLLFFGNPPERGIDKTVFAEDGDEIVMVSILGDLSNYDNPKLEPLIETARKFEGPNYIRDVEYQPLSIPQGWRPDYLLPENSSDYFYYKGNFPIPPCFQIPRIYVIWNPIYISPKQLNVLTHIKSGREPNGVLACTMAQIQEEAQEGEVFHNPKFFRLQNEAFGLVKNSDIKLGSGIDALTLITTTFTIFIMKKMYLENWEMTEKQKWVTLT